MPWDLCASSNDRGSSLTPSVCTGFCVHCTQLASSTPDVLTRHARSVLLQDDVENLGPWGPVLFVAAVAGCEMIPLFPTQPLSLAAGLLFGPVEVGCAAAPARPVAVRWVSPAQERSPSGMT